MSVLSLWSRHTKLVINNSVKSTYSEPLRLVISSSYCQHSKLQPKDDEEFRVLQLKPKKQAAARRKHKKQEVLPPRTSMMPVDQDWSNVWPGPRTFHPASVPLPVRQGYNKKGASPGKFANAELMKIPNFLHLTPPAIKKHCEALKRFCTAWPEVLDNDSKCEEALPLEVITTDYCHSSPTIRDPLARIATIKVKLNRLPLDAHAKDKLLRLVGERYNPENDILTIVTDRCPLRQQNYDYALYLLTALFHESWKIEAWESEKSEADMEYYDWETSKSRHNILKVLSWPEDQNTVPHTTQLDLKEYKESVSEIMNQGEEEHTLRRYKENVKRLLNLPDTSHTSRPL